MCRGSLRHGHRDRPHTRASLARALRGPWEEFRWRGLGDQSTANWDIPNRNRKRSFAAVGFHNPQPRPGVPQLTCDTLSLHAVRHRFQNAAERKRNRQSKSLLLPFPYSPLSENSPHALWDGGARALLWPDLRTIEKHCCLLSTSSGPASACQYRKLRATRLRVWIPDASSSLSETVASPAESFREPAALARSRHV